MRVPMLPVNFLLPTFERVIEIVFLSFRLVLFVLFGYFFCLFGSFWAFFLPPTA